ncbi:MAG: hypothetical protein WCT03_02110 [Candidatus Obscuribacterales bacterium]|jgi:tetratricopeptide (TPR) repeat protein
MRQIGIRLGQVASSAAAAVAITSLGAQSAMAKLPSTFADPAAEDGAKSAGSPSTNLFVVRTSTAEKMQAMSNVSLLNERISQMQENSAAAPKLNLDPNLTKISPQKREMFERAMAASQSRKLAALLNQRGTCLALIGERSKAISDLDEAVISDKNYAPAFNNRAWMMAQAGNLDAAMVDVNKAIELAPEMAEAYDTRGTIHMALKEYDAAMKDFNSSVEHKDDYAEAYYHRAVLHKLQGRMSQFSADEKRAIELGYPVQAQ